MICLIALLISSATKCQPAGPSPILTKDEYLVKSRGQRTAALVFAGMGSAMIFVGALVGIDDVGGMVDPADKDNSNFSRLLFYEGLALAAMSIPFFVSSKKKRKKATALSH